MGKLDGKVALITGIGSGIGRASAKLFAESGATVFGVDCNVETSQELAVELQDKGLQFYFFAADLSTQQACIDAVAECYKTHEKVDILYNNAGISSVEPFDQISQASLERMLATNFMSVFYLCQQVIPKMQQQGSGKIINTASELAIVAQPQFTSYCASKGAVLSFTRSLALEYSCDNIQINAICPGPIDTNMLRKEFETELDPNKAKEESIASVPIGRLGRAEEIAQVALFLASDAPQLLHGSSLLVDGAKTIL